MNEDTTQDPYVYKLAKDIADNDDTAPTSATKRMAKEVVRLTHQLRLTNARLDERRRMDPR
jgi:hypothetical protein